MITLYTPSGTTESPSVLDAGIGRGSISTYQDQGDSAYKDRTLSIHDEASDPTKTQMGYGTKPMTGEDIEAIANERGRTKGKNGSYKSIDVGDGIHKDFDTTNGLADLKATTSNIIDGNVNHDFNQMMDVIRKELYLPTSNYSFKGQLDTLSKRYNRYKLPNYDMEIRKGFAHVFFVRPHCYLLGDGSSGLRNSLKAVDSFNDIYEQNPVLVRELDNSASHKSDFMFLLSNYVKSFSLNDEELHSDTYGKTYTGYKISYGKTNIESRTAGSFSVTYSDDKVLSIYKIHRLWTDYISGAYRGLIDPRLNDIANKTLDYVGAVYYILTAEDNETILFWSKYYGVYPTSIPSSQYSWNSGSYVNPENITISYNYSWKEDYKSTAIQEFNFNARLYNISDNKVTWVPNYDSRIGTKTNTGEYVAKLGTTGRTIVGTPFIERLLANETLKKSLPYTDRFVYKLRFIPEEKMYD